MNGSLGNSIVMIAIMLNAPSAWGDEPNKPSDKQSAIKIGVFDSRAVAIAYYRSSQFSNKLKSMHAHRDKAKSAGDDSRVKQLETEGSELQHLAHKQGFGVWPIWEITKSIEADLPAAAKSAGVVMIVSRWDIVFQSDNLAVVDVTDHLVRLLNPSEQTLKIIADVRKKTPIAIGDLKPMSPTKRPK